MSDQDPTKTCGTCGAKIVLLNCATCNGTGQATDPDEGLIECWGCDGEGSWEACSVNRRHDTSGDSGE